MFVYIIPFLLTIVGVIVYDIRQVQGIGKNALWFFLYLYLTLLIGLRYMVGGDTFFYHQYFNWLSLTDLFYFNFNDDYQPFFVQSMLIAKAIYPKFISYQLLHVLFINTILFWFIKKCYNERS